MRLYALTRLSGRLLVTVGSIAVGAAASGSTITLSGISSDLTPASQLDAILEFDVGEFDAGSPGDELRLTLSNPAAGDGLFNINELYWNGSPAVAGLTLLTATHSVAGDVFADWKPVEPGSIANGFGTFDFALTNGVGETDDSIAEPGEHIIFIFDINGIGVTMTDFVEANGAGLVAAAKFVNGPDDPESPGNEDSAFGAQVPEPGTATLIALGLIGMGAVRRRHSD